MYLPPARKSETPWGAAQFVLDVLPGIKSVSTASHGGYWLDDDRLARFVAVFPDFPRWSGSPAWFEEDCDWAAVAVLFPEAFTDAQLSSAVGIMERYVAEFRSDNEVANNYPAAWLPVEAYYLSDDGKPVRDRVLAFRESVKDCWRVTSYGSPPDGYPHGCWFVVWRHATTGARREGIMADSPGKSYWTDAEIEAGKFAEPKPCPST